MKFSTGILAITASLSSSVSALPATTADTPQPYGFWDNNVIYQPVVNESIIYPRYAELKDGTILVSASLGGHVPIYQSKDGGATWTHLSDIVDKVNGWGFSAQPCLYVLPEAQGDYPAGTVLSAAGSWGNTTRIDLYASRDNGLTWEFASHIAEGGKPLNGTSIFEPFLLQYEGQLVAYYSDERDPEHAQKLSHQTSKDLKNWGPVVEDVAYPDQSWRPGMTIVDYIPTTKKWILVYEMGTGTRIDGNAFPAYYVLADSPLDFRLSKGQLIQQGTKAMGSSPYVIWTSIGGPNGTLIVTDATKKRVFTNSFAGEVDKWEAHDTQARPAYARALQILKGRPDRLLIYGAETWSGIGGNNRRPLTVTAVSVTELLKTPFDE